MDLIRTDRFACELRRSPKTGLPTPLWGFGSVGEVMPATAHARGIVRISRSSTDSLCNLAREGRFCQWPAGFFAALLVLLVGGCSRQTTPELNRLPFEITQEFFTAAAKGD